MSVDIYDNINGIIIMLKVSEHLTVFMRSLRFFSKEITPQNLPIPKKPDTDTNTKKVIVEEKKTYISQIISILKKQKNARINEITLIPTKNFIRIDTPNTKSIILRKDMGNVVIEVHYKPTGVKDSYLCKRLLFCHPYFEIIENSQIPRLKKKIDKEKTLENKYNTIYSADKKKENYDKEYNRLMKVINYKSDNAKAKMKILQNQNKGSVEVNFYFVIRNKEGVSLIANCYTENKKLIVYNVACTNDVGKTLKELRGLKPLKEDIGPKFISIDKAVQQGLIQYLYLLGLNKNLLSYIESSALEKYQKLYLKWFKDMKDFIKPS